MSTGGIIMQILYSDGRFRFITKIAILSKHSEGKYQRGGDILNTIRADSPHTSLEFELICCVNREQFDSIFAYVANTHRAVFILLSVLRIRRCGALVGWLARDNTGNALMISRKSHNTSTARTQAPVRQGWAVAILPPSDQHLPPSVPHATFQSYTDVQVA